MANRERIITILRNQLRSCIPSMYSIYVDENIPPNKCRNAINSYAPQITESDVIALVDETIFGSAKTGVLFTETGFYYNGGYKKYSDNVQFKNFRNYDTVTKFNTMLSELYKADKHKSVSDRIDGANNTIDTIDQAIDKIKVGFNKVKKWYDFLESISSKEDDKNE